MKQFSITLLFSLASLFVFGQGKIRGVVTDKKNNETLPFAVVKVEGQAKGAKTDFDGQYVLSLPAGEYTLIFSLASEGYIDQKIKVALKDKEVVELDVALGMDAEVQQLSTVTITATRKSGTSTEAVLTERRNSDAATDGTGRAEMKERGVATAEDAVKQVTGVSTVNNQVFVRGLGDRYTKTILNSLEIPGLDPDKNAVQMDIFPATIIDKITVYKTFLPNLSGDFTGGLVDITTRDFPAKKAIYAKLSLGYNTQTTFNKGYHDYQGGAIDFLGFDDGIRKNPINANAPTPDPTQNNPLLTQQTNAFSKVMDVENKSNFLNTNFAFSIGDQINNIGKKENSDLHYGYNFVVNYRNSFRFYQQAQFNEFRRSTDTTSSGLGATELFKDRTSTGTVAEHNVLWTALLGQSFKFKKRNQISLTLLHIQNGKSASSKLREENFESNQAVLEKTGLTYTQRSISNANISGKHLLDKWRVDWKLAPTYSRISDPDLRSTALEIDKDANGNEIYLFTPSVGSEIRRTFRNLTEINGTGRIDATWNFHQWDSLKGNIQFGAMNTYKMRDFSITDYYARMDNMSTTNVSNDPNWYFQNENIWTVAKDSGTYISGQSEPANNFNASINVAGAYLMNKLPLTKRLSTTYGLRVEHALYKFTGQNNNGTIIYNDTTTLNKFSFLPSVNLVYKIEKDAKKVEGKRTYKRYTNWRASYSQTVARPSFKEKSVAAIYDPIQGRTYNGNLDLLQTQIHNADLRWEWFFGRTELISASAFYKRFINPIEIAAYPTAPSNVKAINAGVANVYGAEVEIRKRIGFNSEEKDHIKLIVGANFTYVLSQIDMREVKVVVNNTEVSQKEDRLNNAVEGEKIGNFRPMFGQSPYIANGFLTFRQDSIGLSMNLSYNVQGKRLAVVGVGKIPDVYELPFHSLNFKASMKFGKQKRWKTSLTVRNILNQKRRRVYQSFGDSGLKAPDTRFYDYFHDGTSFSVGVSFTMK